jgi:hypothetical protein
VVSFEQAKIIAQNFINDDLVILEDNIIEKDFGWFFTFASKKTGEFLFGSNGFIVDREDGRIYELGSAFSVERDLQMYELGYKFKSYNLTIISVSNFPKTIYLLHKLRMKYVTPEFEHGTVWKIPKEYSYKELTKCLLNLPITFENQAFYFELETLEKLKQSKCCKFELEGKR